MLDLGGPVPVAMAGPGQIPQFTDRLRRDEGGLEQPVRPGHIADSPLAGHR